MVSRSLKFGRVTLIPLLAFAAAGLAGCRSEPTRPTGSAAAAGRACFVEGVDDRAQCHSIEVPEDWAVPDGRKIRLHVAVLASTGTNKDNSALFVLAGGPGQAASDYGDLVAGALGRVRATRPVILMDQRGTGASNGLRCRFGGATLAEVEAAATAGELARCRVRWNATLQHYTTPDVVRDMDAVRERLGFATLDLWGASWGTRTALLYMRQYPQRVRSAVLDGVTGPNTPLLKSEARFAQEALDSLLTACARDRACNQAFPDLGRRVAERLGNDNAVAVRYTAPNGVPSTTTLEADTLRQIVRGALYAPESASRLPYALHHLLGGDATAMLAIANGSAGMLRETMYHGATFSALCAEELPRVTAEDIRKGSRSSFAKDSFARGWAEGCSGWPVKPLPAGYGDPVRSKAPVLLLSGALDPITPPASAEAVRPYLAHSWHAVAPALGHNVTGTGCAGRLIAEFVRKGSGDGLDVKCLAGKQRPPFMLTSNGPGA